MNFDWREYCNLATSLASPTCNVGNEEARLRSAISRAYYGAFNRAKVRLLGSGYRPVGRDTHEQTILDIEQAGQKQAAAFLRRMKEARLRADYDESPNARLRELAAKTLTEAQSVLQAVK